MQNFAFYSVYICFLKKNVKSKNIQNIKKMIMHVKTFSKHAFSKEYKNELK